MPDRAAAPVPVMMAVGVASPSAQGQAITSTETAEISAFSISPVTASQPPKVTIAINTTTGTNVLAEVNGDGLTITDVSGGAGDLLITDVGTTGTATSLGIAGNSTLDADGDDAVLTGTAINSVGGATTATRASKRPRHRLSEGYSDDVDRSAREGIEMSRRSRPAKIRRRRRCVVNCRLPRGSAVVDPKVLRIPPFRS